MLKPSISLVDMRGKTPVDLLRSYPDKAHALVRAARRTRGIWSQAASALALPLADKRSHAWLKRTNNPYLHEIESFNDVLECKGIYALNLAYEWGCSSGAYRTEDSVSMLRVLDWPFPDLGRHALVTWQQGKAGNFYNVTWPGMAGMFTGMAPGRFSAALNMAPMRGYGFGFIGDWFKNRLVAKRQDGMPPSHLLRRVFEQAENYEAARRMLAETKLAVPSIFVLAGVRAGQGCVIERLEDRAEIRELGAGQGVAASNHFTSPLAQTAKKWHPREIDSPGRLRQCEMMHGHELSATSFGWLKPPIINAYTRLCVIADAATGRLMVQGYEGAAQVTELFNAPGEAAASSGDAYGAWTGAASAG